MATTLYRSTINLHRPTAGTSGRAAIIRQVPWSGSRCLRLLPRAAEADTAPNPSPGIGELIQRRKDIELEIKLAVKGEDFKAAARLKEELEALNRKDPVMVAKKALEQAIKEERYEDAARIKAQIKQLEDELGPAALMEAGLITTQSTAITRGIKVQVQSFYLPTKSSPSAGRYMFAYHVTITNETTDAIVQLRNRHWIITDARGKTEEVRGPGVVGEQPILLPGKSHEYTSGCPLSTPQGSMEGEYTMVVLSPEDGQWAETIEVKIGKFMLDSKGPKAI
ncbi:hypothetical protein VOLCADRAFT_105396 [Volvox carteri f. nagariensis]|uniref:ApaG domain-containing protein n=1 Tax=Volvox carteri f. nagariensis TaxID=3068 RepID=D8U0J9_VOLCA|nr:uncharacterized protein VOLCADRAFT_105396 [Volvox carteri f. nagariensis]EFJ46732.1 hypothetical protein VOLCADRAFT_105396 [Volvox carteri f. nagariensis]|eukprot:XP_002952261.1 hypothetical protein VOLCADRAFT_105396 [Volvox carteri f. nagariensis]